MRIKAIAVEVSKLALKPGDVILLRFAHALPMVQIERIREDMRRVFPNNETVIIDKIFADISIVQPIEAPAHIEYVDDHTVTIRQEEDKPAGEKPARKLVSRVGDY